MSPVAINGVDKQGVYVNGVQVKQALNAANETVAKGVFDETTLSAVDADLAVGNIALGVTIFGKVGTLVAGTLAEDVEGDTVCVIAQNDTGYKYTEYRATDLLIATKTLNFDPDSIAFAAGFVNAYQDRTPGFTLRLYMGGVMMQETAELPVDTAANSNFLLRDFKALSGSLACYLEAHHNADARLEIAAGARADGTIAGVIAVGSVKLV